MPGAPLSQAAADQHDEVVRRLARGLVGEDQAVHRTAHDGGSGPRRAAGRARGGGLELRRDLLAQEGRGAPRRRASRGEPGRLAVPATAAARAMSETSTLPSVARRETFLRPLPASLTSSRASAATFVDSTERRWSMMPSE